MTPQEIEEQKSVEFYAAGVNAWYNTSLEHDKSVFALSAGGIGLLITLLTTVGLNSSVMLHLYIGAILCFFVSLICILIVFRRNRAHIEQVLTSKNVASDPALGKLDLVALVAFGIGAALAALIGISAAVSSFEKGKAVATENKSQTPTPVPLRESFNGVQNLQPQTEFTKSFNGIGGLQPQVLPAPAPPVASAPNPAPPAATNSNSGKQGS
jgi:hypothetical protein